MLAHWLSMFNKRLILEKDYFPSFVNHLKSPCLGDLRTYICKDTVCIPAFSFQDSKASYDFNDYDNDPMPRTSDPNNW